ncbi:MAG: hypothetical protein ABI658_05175 [Acidimicrobiales bacterium]
MPNAVGPDRIVWGTDSTGYPTLNPEVKRMVLGLNAAHLFNIDPARSRCAGSGA